MKLRMRVRSFGWLMVGAMATVLGAGACGSDGEGPDGGAGSGPLGGGPGDGGEPGAGGGGAGGGATAGGSGNGSTGGGATAGGSGNGSTGGGATAGGSGNASGGRADTGGSDSGGASTGGVSTGGSAGVGGSSGGGSFSGYDIVMSSIFDGDDTDGEQARDVAFDAQGNFVMVGGTSSPDFPTTAGAYDRTHSGPDSSGLGNGGDYDVFVTKFDPSGNILWSTFLGNGGYERAYAVEFGPGGDVYVAGRASRGYPTTPGAYQEVFQGDDDVNPPYGEQDGFVTRLSADGSSIVWSTFVGESGRSLIRDMDVDASGKVYLGMPHVTGVFSPAPAAWGPRATPGGRDAFYGVLAADGSALLYGNYMGGSSNTNSDGGNPCVRVAPSGDVYLLTYTDSADFTCVGSGAYDSTHNGSEDLVLARYTAGTNLAWCTFLGGGGIEGIETHSLAIDASGNPVIATASRSDDAPTTAGVVQSDLSGPVDAFVAIVSQDGAELIAATYFGGVGSDWAEGVAIAPNGDIVFTGGTDSDDLLVTPNALKSSVQGRDGLIVHLSPDLTQVRYASYYGGSGQDDIRSAWVSPTGRLALVGSTISDDFPAVNGVSGAPDGNAAVVAALIEPLP